MKAGHKLGLDQLATVQVLQIRKLRPTQLECQPLKLSQTVSETRIQPLLKQPLQPALTPTLSPLRNRPQALQLAQEQVLLLKLDLSQALKLHLRVTPKELLRAQETSMKTLLAQDQAVALEAMQAAVLLPVELQEQQVHRVRIAAVQAEPFLEQGHPQETSEWSQLQAAMEVPPPQVPKTRQASEQVPSLRSPKA
jgi:hypothetical protein